MNPLPLLISSVLASCLSLHAAGAPKKPVQVFILAGQSKMEGHGFIAAEPKRNDGKGSLEFLVKAPASAPLSVGYGASAERIGEAMGKAKLGLAAAGPAGYQTRGIEGWTVHLSDTLLAEQKDAVEAALPLLQKQLAEIVRVVPPAAVAKLREVPLWFSPEYPNLPGRAEYHPGADWLRENGRNPIMVKGVEFTDVRHFEKEMIRMPNFALHELAHAYHDRVLSFKHADIAAAYEHAKAQKLYERVERWHGNGKANTVERAYALTNPMEYFAETTEAYFSRNDFFPFTRQELEKHDPKAFEVLKKVWNTP